MDRRGADALDHSEHGEDETAVHDNDGGSGEDVVVGSKLYLYS